MIFWLTPWFYALWQAKWVLHWLLMKSHNRTTLNLSAKAAPPFENPKQALLSPSRMLKEAIVYNKDYFITVE